MAQNDNVHAIRFINSMNKNNEHDKTLDFVSNHPLSASADFKKKFEWAKEQCKFLINNFDEEKIKKIRMGCACGLELGKIKKLKDLYTNNEDLSIFVERSRKLKQAFELQYDGKYLYLVYPQCYCSCVKRIDETLPKQWCYCTLGYTKNMFEFIFDSEVDVELLSSIKLGDKDCRIKIVKKK